MEGERKLSCDFEVDHGSGGSGVEKEVQAGKKANPAFDGDEEAVAKLEGQSGV